MSTVRSDNADAARGETARLGWAPRSAQRAPAGTAFPRPAFFGGLVLGVACLYWARVILVPIAVALLLSFLLSPVIALVRRTGLGQAPAVVIVVLLVLTLASGLGWALFFQVTTLANDLPLYRATISRKIADAQRVGTSGPLQKIEDTAKDVITQIQRPTSNAEKPVPVEVSSPHPFWQVPVLMEVLVSAVLVLVLLVFMLIQQQDLRARVIRLFGQDRLAEATRVFDEAGSRISRYLVIQSTLNACFGVAIAVGLFLIGLPFALMCGAIAMLMRFIPYAGAWGAAALPMVTSLAVFDGWTKPLLIAGLFAATEVTLAFVMEPLFFARSAAVSSIALLVATALWTWLWGPVGLALAVPLTVCLVVFSRTVPGLEFIEILVAEEPGVVPHLIYYQRALAGDEQEAAELIRDAAKADSVEAAFDTILVPALGRARRDRDAGQLTPREYAHIAALTRAVVARLPVPAAAAESAPPDDIAVIAGCGGRDDADRVALELLGRLLESAPTPCALRVIPGGGSMTTVVEGVRAIDPALICLGSLAPDGRLRHLVIRLRQAFPNTPLVAGCWGDQEAADLRGRLADAGADEIVTTLAEARDILLQMAPATYRQPVNHLPAGSTEIGPAEAAGRGR